MSGFLTKIAHSNRVAIARPNDVKLLGEVISTEKKVVDSVRRVATDRSKSSIAIREWGVAEGADLGDVLSQLGVLFDYLSTAEHTFAEHDTNYRLHFKSIRTKEENLAALKRAKESLAGKIESQDKKVAKMREENKDLPSASQRLMEMRQEMVAMENSVMNDEAHLYDFKRSAVRDAMSLKLGALTELSERMTIIGELGKLITDELPRDRTEPGGPRPYYEGHEKTQGYILEAQRCLQGVVFNPVPLTPNQLNEGRNGSGEEPRQDGNVWGGNNPNGNGNGNGQGANEYDYGHGQGYGQASPQDQTSPRGYGHETYQDSTNAYYGGESHQDQQQYDQHGRRPSGMQPLPQIETSPIEGVADLATPTTEHAHAPPPPPVDGYASATPYLGPHHDFDGVNRSSMAYLSGEEGIQEEEQQQRHVENEWARTDEQAGAGAGGGGHDQSATSPASFQQEIGSPASVYPDDRRPSIENQMNAAPASIGQTANFAPPLSQSHGPSSNYAPSPSNNSLSQSQPSSTLIYAAYNKSKPPIIRGESALGSKHGDIYVQGRSEPTVGSASGGLGGPFQGAGTSGYNSRAGGDTASVGSNDARKINAGAFRRNPQPQYSLPPVTMQQDSRYPTPHPTSVPSPADAIRDHYRANSISEDKGPRFDVSPLHVNKSRAAAGAGQQPARGSTLPHSSSYSNIFPSTPQRPSENERWRDSHPDVPESPSGPASETDHSTSLPSYSSPDPNTPVTPTMGSSGFGSSQFVTRLD